MTTLAQEMYNIMVRTGMTHAEMLAFLDWRRKKMVMFCDEASQSVYEITMDQVRRIVENEMKRPL